MITKFNNFINEEFNFFKKKYKNIDIINAIEENGLILDNVGDEIYTTKTKDGYVFTIASGSDSFRVIVRYNGKIIKDELIIEQLSEYINDILNGETPN